MVSLSAYLGVGALLFAIAVIGIFLNRKNLIVLLMAIELMLLAVNTNFIAFSRFLGDLHGKLSRFIEVGFYRDDPVDEPVFLHFSRGHGLSG